MLESIIQMFFLLRPRQHHLYSTPSWKKKEELTRGTIMPKFKETLVTHASSCLTPLI